MRWTPLAAFAVALTVALYGAAPDAQAKTKTFQDEMRGVRLRVPDSFSQVPPKLTGPVSHIAAQWFDDQAKYRSKPEFKMTWFATPTNVPPPMTGEAEGEGEGEGGDGDGDGPPDMKELLEQMQAQMRPKSLDDAVDRLMRMNPHLFGDFVPMKERWQDEKAVDEVRTKSKIKAQVLEINYSKKRQKDGPPFYMMVARLPLELPDADVEVGFYGHCHKQYAKKLRKDFLAIVRSFELKGESDAATEDELDKLNRDDPEAFVEYVIANKVIKGWDYYRTPEKNYLLLYDQEVRKDLIRRIGTEIEAIRAQVYEELFPPDRPITAVSVVRICKDRQQYFAYGGPGGSAGYWSPGGKELVFYEDQNNKKNSIAVLYHEAFHQYIFYSVGDLSPHSWFNEGHGDFFAGHRYKGGKFERREFRWRKDLAKQTKRSGKAPPLKDWLRWDQRQYYGRNDYKLPGGVNYALGWDFIYFLRTTRNEDYQRILPTYFNTLKSFVTQSREAREKALDDALGGGEKKDGEGEPAPAPAEEGEAPEKGSTSDVVPREEWHDRSIDSAFKGIDLDQLEKDWLKF